MAKKPAKSKVPASKRGRQKGEQTHLPGVEPEKNATIHPLAVNYCRVRDNRMEIGREEVKLKNRLLAAMHQEALKRYTYDDIDVLITEKEELKVKVHGHDPEANGKGK